MPQQQGSTAAATAPPHADPGHVDAAASSAMQAQAQALPSRNASSKYDFVKVKVWLGENADHYYVLSRFLLSRMLTVTKIPNHVAIKIALELKKLLVDNSLLDVYGRPLYCLIFHSAHASSSHPAEGMICMLELHTLFNSWISSFRSSQSDLEANLFKLMEKRGYGEEYINLYKMMTRFHHQRVPLVILVCGTACTGKSTIATQLAQRLNLPNVLQTDMVYELLRTSTDAPLTSVPVWARDFNSPEELITEFCRECRVVRKGLAGDLKKAMKDGKPIIIEGIHLDPRIYLMDEEKRDDNSSVEKAVQDSENSGFSVERNTEHQSKNGLAENRISPTEENENIVKSKEGTPEEGGGHKDSDQPKNNTTKKDKSAAEPIVVPIVLRMSDFDHKALLEEWIATRAFSDNCLPQDHRKLINNLKLIQDYLCSFESQGLTIVDISASSFPQTLDWLHSYLLQCIERGLLAACSESCKQG